MAKPAATEVVQLGSARRGCRNCGLREHCLPFGMQDDDVERLNHLVGNVQALAPGQRLVHAGEPLRNLFVVRSGALKSTRLVEDGGEQIVGFHLPGELAGVDALCCNRHLCDVVALQRSQVCALPYRHLQEFASHAPNLYARLMRLIGRDIVLDHQQMLAMGRKDAVGRVAMLLCGLADRHQRMRLDPHRIELPMSRDELANYLGLVEETVSRALTHLRKLGAIEVRRKTVLIRDHHSLAELCGGSETAAEGRESA